MEKENKIDKKTVDALKEKNYWEQGGGNGVFSSFWLTLKEVLFHPKKFFSSMPTTGGGVRPLLFGILVYLLSSVAGLFYIGITFFLEIEPYVKSSTLLIIYFIILLLSPIWIILSILLNSIITHLCLVIVGAKKGFQTTLKVISYSTALNIFYIFYLPMILFASTAGKFHWPDPIGKILGIASLLFLLLGILMTIVWPLVLQMIGYKLSHHISLTRAIFGIIIYLIVVALVSTILSFGGKALLIRRAQVKAKIVNKIELVQEELKFVGQDFPPFVLDDLEFNAIKFEDLKGKVVVFSSGLDFKSIKPILNELTKKYVSIDVQLFAMAGCQRYASMKKMAKKKNIAFPILLDCGEVSEYFWGEKTPFFNLTKPIIIILDKKGVVRYAYMTRRVIPSGKILSKNIDQLLAETINPSSIKTAQRVQINKPRISQEGIIEYEGILHYQNSLKGYKGIGYSPRAIGLVDSLGKSAIKEPPKAFEKRFYGVIPFGKTRENLIKVIVDVRKKPRKIFSFWERSSYGPDDFVVYFDKNNNNDLTEEQERMAGQGFLRVENIKIKYDDGTFSPIAVGVYLQNYNQLVLGYRKDFAMEGQINIKDKEYKIAIMNDNINRFFSIPGTTVLLDFNQNGKFDVELDEEAGRRYYVNTERVDPRKSFEIDSILYRISYISPKGDKVRIQQVSQ